MTEDMQTAYIFTGSIVLAFVIFFFVIAYEGGERGGLLAKYLCRMNMHKNHRRVGFKKKKTYYCIHCKKARNHPALKLVDGGNKIRENTYKP